VGHAGFAPEEFSGHSLNAGFVTSAAATSANERDIMQHTRHKSEQMVRRYIRKVPSSKETWLIYWASNGGFATRNCGSTTDLSSLMFKIPPTQPSAATEEEGPSATGLFSLVSSPPQSSSGGVC
jgi:hypothetical protein